MEVITAIIVFIVASAIIIPFAVFGGRYRYPN